MKDDKLDNYEFTQLLFDKTKELFPVLNCTDCHKKLTAILNIHSQASRVYEAVWWLTLTWNETDRSGGTTKASSSLRRLLVWVNVLHACVKVLYVHKLGCYGTENDHYNCMVLT